MCAGWDDNTDDECVRVAARWGRYHNVTHGSCVFLVSLSMIARPPQSDGLPPPLRPRGCLPVLGVASLVALRS